ADAAKATDASLATASARIDETVTAAEARIAAARAAALGEVEGVAAEAAQDIASRLAGLSIPAAEAQAAVKGVLANG
ncbi:MAG: ATPase, partial [Novosphingobium sp.]